MKRSISVFLCTVLILCITACSGGDHPKPAKGVLNGKSFSSEYTGVRFTAPSDSWTFASDAELAAACNLDPAEFTAENFSNIAESSATVYDMLAQSEEDKIALLVGIENPEYSAVCSSTSAKDFVNNTIDSLLSTLDIESNTHQISDIEKVRLCGHEYVRRTLTVETETEKAIQSYYARSIGDYLCIIVISHTGDTTTEQVEKLFS
ncbi:MAG: hypothetical protein IJA62_02850 [Ruminococcus sp.]|nr:hypothetical protein [Ruminococcus sp.]